MIFLYAVFVNITIMSTSAEPPSQRVRRTLTSPPHNASPSTPPPPPRRAPPSLPTPVLMTSEAFKDLALCAAREVELPPSRGEIVLNRRMAPPPPAPPPVHRSATQPRYMASDPKVANRARGMAPPPPTPVPHHVRAEVSVLLDRIASDVEEGRKGLKTTEETLVTALRRMSERLDAKLETLRGLEEDYARGIPAVGENETRAAAAIPSLWVPVQTQLTLLVEALEHRQRLHATTGQSVQDEVRRTLESLRARLESERQTREANLASVVSLVEAVVVGRLVKQVQDMRTHRVHRLQNMMVEKT